MSYDTIGISPILKQEMSLAKKDLTWNEFFKECFEAWKEKQVAKE